MVDLIDLKQFRLVDLSIRMVPGIRKVTGEYQHGEFTRRLQVTQFLVREQSGDLASMHWIDAESHIGTHVEGPSHFKDELRSVGDMPPEPFIGEAVLFRFTEPRPLNGEGQPIKPEHLCRSARARSCSCGAPTPALRSSTYPRRPLRRS